jgi:hypothetical protein
MKQKKQLAVLAVLLLTAGAIWFFYLDHDKSVVTADAGNMAQNTQVLSVENPQLHTDKLEKARKTEYKSTGRNIFSAIPPPPPPRPLTAAEKEKLRNPPPPPPPPPPVVSPLPAKFYGYGTIPNGTIRVAFFYDGEGVEVVREGEVLKKNFRILKIGNASLEYEEISTGLRGTANLDEQAGPPSA